MYKNEEIEIHIGLQTPYMQPHERRRNVKNLEISNADLLFAVSLIQVNSVTVFLSTPINIVTHCCIISFYCASVMQEKQKRTNIFLLL